MSRVLTELLEELDGRPFACRGPDAAFEFANTASATAAAVEQHVPRSRYGSFRDTTSAVPPGTGTPSKLASTPELILTRQCTGFLAKIFRTTPWIASRRRSLSVPHV